MKKKEIQEGHANVSSSSAVEMQIQSLNIKEEPLDFSINNTPPLVSQGSSGGIDKDINPNNHHECLTETVIIENNKKEIIKQLGDRDKTMLTPVYSLNSFFVKNALLETHKSMDTLLKNWYPRIP